MGSAMAQEKAASPSAKTEASPAQNAAKTLVGAIRWDGWNKWGFYDSCFDAPEWRYRLPFFATITPEGKARLRETSQEVIDKEIVYAKTGGLDYWAFLWYHPESWAPESGYMGECLEYYLSSKHKTDVNYCLILSSEDNLAPKPKVNETLDYFVQRFKDPNYQKVLGNRPLVYFFQVCAFLKDLGSEQAVRAFFDDFRKRTVAAGLANPYFVVMSFNPDEGAKEVDMTGSDALSSYTAHLVGQPFTNNQAHPYSELVENNRKFWEMSKETGKAIIPTANTGWDYRCMKMPQHEGRNPMEDWYEEPTARQVGENVKNAVMWVKANPAVCPANSILIYAWNELSEGGWLVPTLTEGSARLDAIAAALKPGSGQRPEDVKK
jgi:hypothetical protein